MLLFSMSSRKVKKSFSSKEATRLILLGSPLDNELWWEWMVLMKKWGGLRGVMKNVSVDEKLSADLEGVMVRFVSLDGVNEKMSCDIGDIFENLFLT